MQVPDCIEQSSTSPILYDARTNWKPSDFKEKNGQHWDKNQGRHLGPIGEGKIEYSKGLLSIERLNDIGRYDIELTRYNVNGRMYTIIPPSEEISSKRFTVKFEARATLASFSCCFLFKIVNPDGEITFKNRTIPEGVHWSPCTFSFHLEPRMSYTFRIYIIEVSGAPSQLQIRNLTIVDESF